MTISHQPGVVRLLVVSFFAALLVGCEKPEPEKTSGAPKIDKPVAVKTVAAVNAMYQPEIAVTGTLEADADVTIAAKVPGRIVSIDHDLGDRVAPGATLAVINPRDFELAVNEGAMAVKATLAKLGLADFPAADFDVTKVPTVRRYSFELDNASSRFERLRKLYEQTPPLISQQEFADAQTAFQVARSAFELEQVNARALLAEAQTRQAELEQARQRLVDATIRAPMPSDKAATPYAVAQRMVAVGDYVKEGDALFRILVDDPIRLRAMVPERFAVKVAAGLKVRVTLRAFDEPFEGVVSRVSPQVDVVSRAFPVEILIANPKAELKVGAFAMAAILLPERIPVVEVPTEAIVSFAGVNRVFIADGDKATQVRVTLGEPHDGKVHVFDGLKGGEAVILSPPTRMINGTPITTAAAPASVAPRSTAVTEAP